MTYLQLGSYLGKNPHQNLGLLTPSLGCFPYLGSEADSCVVCLPPPCHHGHMGNQSANGALLTTWVFHGKRTSHCCDKILARTTQKEGIFILALSLRGFSPCQLALLFLGQSETKHHGGRTLRSKVAHLMLVRKQRGVPGGARPRYTLQRHTSSDHFLHQGPAFQWPRQYGRITLNVPPHLIAIAKSSVCPMMRLASSCSSHTSSATTWGPSVQYVSPGDGGRENRTLQNISYLIKMQNK